MAINCPKCETQLHIDIRGAVGKDQRFSYRVYPKDGQMMQAQALGQQLTAMDEVMRACGKADGSDLATYVDGIETHEDKSIEFHLIVLPLSIWDEANQCFVEKVGQDA